MGEFLESQNNVSRAKYFKSNFKKKFLTKRGLNVYFKQTLSKYKVFVICAYDRKWFFNRRVFSVVFNRDPNCILACNIGLCVRPVDQN